MSEIDFRVDHSKLIWSEGPAGTLRPPIQCPCEKARQANWWVRIFRSSHDPDGRGDRCVMYLGHWEYPNQRNHINAWGDRWPVSAEDTRPYNP